MSDIPTKIELHETIRVMADNLLTSCSILIKEEGLHESTYDLCFGIVKVCLNYYKQKRNMESYDD